MNSRLLATIIIFPIWLLAIIIFRKHRQWLFYYIIASLGLTLMLVFTMEYLGWDQILVNIISYHISLLTKYFFHIPVDLLTNGRFQIFYSNGQTSVLKLGIECSAIFESCILFALLAFYPMYSFGQKAIRIGFGLIATYIINVFRLMIIIYITYRFGSNYIFIAHAGIARLFFFGCELVLYWYLITKPTLKSVGDSIKNKMAVAQAAKVGRSLQLKHAVAQMIIIIFVLTVGIASFRVSNEWRKAFIDVEHKNRPLIYPEETSIEPVGPNKPNEKPGSVLGENIENTQTPADISKTKETLTDLEKKINSIFTGQGQSNVWQRIETTNLKPQEQAVYQIIIPNNGKFNVKIVAGPQPVSIDTYYNNVLQKNIKIQIPQAQKSIIDKSVLPDPIIVKRDDRIEINFQNIGDKPATYIIEFINENIKE